MALAWPFVALCAVGVLWRALELARTTYATKGLVAELQRFTESCQSAHAGRLQKLEDDLRNLSQRVSPNR